MKRIHLGSFIWVLAVGLAMVSPACIGGLPDIFSGDFPNVPGDDANDDGMTGSGHCEPLGTPDTNAQQQMLNALNSYRIENGLAILMYSDRLEQAAQAHAQDMCVRNFFDHINPDGDGPLDRAVAAGFCNGILIGENVAYGQQSVAEVQNGWEHSPDHNANMLHTGLTFVGMGHYVSILGEDYWVQLFGGVSD